MLIELLKLLNSGGLRSMRDVAQQMGISEALVAEMVEGLARRGYLVAVAAGCGPASACSGCSGCSMEPACRTDTRPPARVLALTEQGRRAAAAA